MVSPEEINRYWIEEVGPEGWYAGGEALDAEITRRYGDALDAAAEGAFGLWLINAPGALAYLILTDQMSRNVHRGTARAFAMDRSALAVAKGAIDKGWDRQVQEPQRQFFYLPLEHSENLCDQDRAVRLIATRMEQDSGELLRHAKAHREIIRRFGRFPTRNEALGRTSSAAEVEWLAAGGYRLALEAVDADRQMAVA